MGKRPRIAVVGSANVDLTTFADRFPKPGETIFGQKFDLGFGGKGANQAVAARLSGADVFMVARVGSDLFGPATIDNFRRLGIDPTYVKQVEGLSSGVAPIFVEPNGQNRILVVKGANDALKPADVDAAAEMLKTMDCIVLQFEIPVETVYYTVAFARRNGDVVFLATMANQVWAFDANDGKQLWQRTLGQPINGNRDIDAHLINDHWGILSTPVIDLAAGVLYACAWISTDGTWQKGQHWLHALHLRDGTPAQNPLSLEGTTYRPGQGLPAQQFRSVERKQRAALTLTQGAVLIPFGTIQETAETARGWLIAVDTRSWTISASWCATARGSGGGIWASGSGPAVDDEGFIYVVTGNGDFDGVTDFGESIVKLKYTPPGAGRAGSLAVVDWWTPWSDDGRVGGNPEGEGRKAMPKAMPSNFRMGPHLARTGMMASMDMASGAWSDQDFGSGGPVLPPSGSTLLASGKDGILYTANTQKLGSTTPPDLDPSKVAENYACLKAPPIFYTYYPGITPAPAPAYVQNLNLYFAQRTHHLHGTPVVWQSATQGMMHFCGGENGNLRAWRLNADGTSTYLACSAEVASPNSPVPPGGMPGWMISLSANGSADGIVWALVPAGDANMELTPGRLLAYDAANFGVYADGSKQLVVLWDSWDWGAGCAFTHPKFNRPVAWNGKVFVPTYDGRVDVYGLA